MKQRIITACCLLVLVLLALYALPDSWWQWAVGCLMLWAASECFSLCSAIQAKLRYALLACVAIAMFLIPYYGWQQYILYLAAVMWLLAAAAVIIYARGGKWYLEARFNYAVIAIIMILAAYVALITLRQQLGATRMLLTMGCVWVMDSGAYFVGRRYGRRALAKRVSPGKTWEGVLGGAVLLLAYLVVVCIFLPAWRNPWWLATLFAAGLFSVLGDLWESASKRVAGVKDSGCLLPGHGGILDRIDGLLAALPWLALAALWSS